MDDEIDIEEHDILEHPQVKAIFPDLSKIQIQVHAAGDPFLDDISAHAEESGYLLEERQDYVDNVIEDGTNEDDSSKATQGSEHALNEDNFDEEVFNEEIEALEDNVSENKEALEDALVISDSECTDDALPTVTEPINVSLEKLGLINKLIVDNKVDVQEISEDEFTDEQHVDSKLIDETEGMEVEESIGSLNKDRILVENIYEISDDETQIQDPEEEKTPRNGDELIEATLKNGIELLKEAVDDPNELTEDAQKNCDEFIEDGVAYSNENLENNNEIGTEIPEQNIEEFEKNNSDEALDVDEIPIRIKEEIEFETESMTSFDETLPQETFNIEELPPEDIYHFNNKIILGSKPSPDVQGNDMSHIKSLVVLLEDWDVHLTRSQSYCEDCQTLFTTPNALDAHRMISHSLLAPITNRAVKSTAKSSLNVARKNIAKKSTGVGMISNSTYCNHCNVTFKDHTTLIKHLYKMLPVKQHPCNICNATFKNQNDLVNHSSVHIKIEHRKILKANKSDNSILKRILSNGMKPMNSKPIKRSHSVDKQIPSKTVKQTPVVREDVAKNWWASRFKCLVCEKVLDSYTVARKHKQLHPDAMVLGKMFERLPSKNVTQNSKEKLKYEDDRIKKSANTKPKTDEPVEFIQRSALFQCPKCSLHFTSCVAAASHVNGNKCNDKIINGNKADDKISWTCPTCKKKFRKKDEACHAKQHEFGAKLKIYKTTKTTYERTLCKCLKCGVHFDYILLKNHIAKCGKITTAKCQKCNILIAKYKMDEHNKKHDIMKLKPKDFILVDYAVANDKTKSKPTAAGRNKTKNTAGKTGSEDLTSLLGKKIKQEPELESAHKQSKTVNKLKFEQDKVYLYYCRHCKSFLSRRAKSHIAKQCAGRYKLTTNCTRCGIKVVPKYRHRHDRLHAENNFSLKDVIFLDIATSKPVTPAIPEYPSCSKCQIHFIDRKMLSDHICGEDYENCEVCGEKFENSALDLHLPFHQLAASRRKPAKRPPKIIPELMMKYESLNAIWNILFICGKCDLVTDLYNKAVEHSQAHLKRTLTQPNTIKCYICNLKFDESCWSKHSELHSRMSINNKDFKILKYTPKNLLDESWFQMFESLPEQEIRQIIDRSVFGSERSLKMRLVKDGLPEFTLYCCSDCQVSYDNNDIRNHVNGKCREPQHVCRECDVAFDVESTLNFHALLHKKGIKKEEFRIVHFVKDSKDLKTAVKVKDINVAKVKKDVKQKPDLKLKKVPEIAAKYVLYKCVNCSSCVQNTFSRGYHICTPEHHLVHCKICKQNFSFRQMGAHRAKHRKLNDFRAKNTRVITFEPIPEGKDKPKRNYKTPRKVPKSSRTPSKQSCKTSLASSISFESEHSSEIEPTSSNPKRRSSVQNFESLVNLLTSENTKTKKRKSNNSSKPMQRVSIESSDAEDKRTANLYKCDCGLHYTSLRAIEKHIETCDDDSDISKENCSKCGLLFPTAALVSHLCKHHSQDTKLTVKEVHKRSSGTEATSTQEKPKSSPVKETIKLYKCSECNVYFLNQNSCYKHTSKHEPLDPKQYIECKMCCLQFRILSLHIHMKKHHETEFNLEKVLVEEYCPSVGKQAPRIDIYFANQRVQNVQVSSSND